MITTPPPAGTPDPHAALLKLQSDLEQCNSSDWVLTFKEGVKLVQQAVAESAAIRLLQSVSVPEVLGDDAWEVDAAKAGLIVNGLSVNGAITNAFYNGHRAGYARAIAVAPAAPLPQPQAEQNRPVSVGGPGGRFSTLAEYLNAEAQGEGSIDSPEFIKALDGWYLNNHNPDNEAYRALIAYIDSWHSARLARTATPDVETAINGLVAALQTSKGWMYAYANSIVRDAIARTAAPSEPTLTPLDYRAQGREEVLAIILAEDAEDPFSECIGSCSNGDSGDYSTHWDDDKLRKLLAIGDRKHDAYDRAEAAYWEALGHKDAAKWEMNLVKRAPFYQPLTEFLAKHKAWDLMASLKRPEELPSEGQAIPTANQIAEDLAAAKRGATCPMCGWDRPHEHTPREIIIYRNGIKWGVRNGNEPWTNDQGPTQDERDDAARTGGEVGSGENEHHEHRAGQPDTDRADIASHSGSDGVSGDREIRTPDGREGVDQPRPVSVEAIPTDLSKRLRSVVVDLYERCIVSRSLILAAADEIDRYYGGMLAWKSLAEAKDAEIGDLRGIIAKKGGAA